MKRTKINGCMWGVVLMLAVSPAAAQDSKPDRPGRGKGNRAARAGHRERGPRGRGGRGIDVKRLRAELQAKLELTTAQQNDVQQILDEYEQQVREARTQRRELLKERRDELDALREKMKAARDAGDREAMNAARKEMRAMFTGGVDERQLQQELHKAIREVLDDAQRPKFERIMQDLSRGRRRPVRLDRLPPGQLLAAADAAKIPQEKADALAQLAEEFEQARKETDRSDREAVRNLFTEYRKELQTFLGTLTDEEKAAMTKAAGKKSGARHKGRGKPRRGRRGDRARPDAP